MSVRHVGRRFVQVVVLFNCVVHEPGSKSWNMGHQMAIMLDCTRFTHSHTCVMSHTRHSLTAPFQVTNMARQMVINYGMSDIGPWSLLDPSAQSGDVVMRMMARNSMSENLQQRIDDAVKKIAEEAYEVALTHIRNNRWAGGCGCVTVG